MKPLLPVALALLLLPAGTFPFQVATAPATPTAAAAAAAPSTAPATQTLQSPNGRLVLIFSLNAQGTPSYALTLAGKPVINESTLGLELRDQPTLASGFSVAAADQADKDETWHPVRGEVKTIRNRYKELAVTLAQAATKNRRIIVRFRLFDDGLGFRYEFPRQDALGSFIVADEKTQFSLTGDHKTFWIPGDYDTNEYAYTVSKLTEVDSSKGNAAAEIAARTVIPGDNVQTPLLMKTTDGLYISIHEAALVDYPAMQLAVDKKALRLTAHLVPDAVGNKAYLQTPAVSPWRTVIVSDKAADILASKTILNLNEPSQIKDTSFIKPQKFVGVWWEMHAQDRHLELLGRNRPAARHHRLGGAEAERQARRHHREREALHRLRRRQRLRRRAGRRLERGLGRLVRQRQGRRLQLHSRPIPTSTSPSCTATRTEGREAHHAPRDLGLGHATTSAAWTPRSAS